MTGYVFHNVPNTDNEPLHAMIFNDLPMKLFSDTFRVDLTGGLAARNTFYLGSRGTNTALHTHTAAINALVVGGPKIWVVVPESSKEAINRFNYGRVRDVGVLDLLLSNLDYLTQEVPGLSIFVQREGDVVYLPHFTFHGTINLGYNVGSAFAFFPQKCYGVRKKGKDGIFLTGMAAAREAAESGCMGPWEDVLRMQAEGEEECLKAHACHKPEPCDEC